MSDKKKTKKKISSNSIVLIVVILLVIAAVVCFLLIRNGGVKQSDQINDAAAPTQAATEFTVTPADSKDIEAFSKSLVGVWTSYTEEGSLYTYTFEKDGSLHFKEDGKDPKEYTYTFEDGFLTVKDSKRTHVYQLSKDAVDMMARMHNGEWQNNFAVIAEEIPNFGGCVYIEDDVMYLGDKCLCSEAGLKSYDVKSLEGKWVGVVGDIVDFAADGSYTYVKNAITYKGAYTVDYDKKTLDMIINGESHPHNEDTWGISGRVFHIGKQYYFKMS